MNADFWLNLQIKFDLYLVQKKEKQALGRFRQMGNPEMREAA
jgi:plasmid maintenance system antidote protein VapI